MTLVWAAALFRHALPGVYYAPQLWGTVDGVIPYHRFWAEFVLMGGHVARGQHSIAAAVALAMAGEEAESDRAKVRAIGWPSFRGV